MHDFIQNAFNNLNQANELLALKAEVAHLQSENLLVREESDRHYQLWVNRGHEIERLNSLIANSEHENARKIHGLQQDNESLQNTVDRLEADKS